ncbi:hypothetical protein [Micromonospora sp. NPDC048839]|uniref:hypothetical protein n=1 Tax=Micromonospora sp. NPDC048839 TaxID=3155641 RepID=UPI0033F4CBB0
MSRENAPFLLTYLEPYAEAARTWLHAEAEVVDTTHLTPTQAATQIVLRVAGESSGVRPQLPVSTAQESR